MKTSEASTKLGGFKQLFQMLHSNKRLSYSEPQKNDDDAINNFFSSVRAHDGTTPIELIIDTETLLTNVYAIGSKSSLNIAKVLQYRFREGGITINIWSDNAQKEFMGSVCKLLRAYGVGSKKYEAHKNNHNPAKRRIQEIKGTTWTIFDHYGAPSWSWILCMAYVVAILNYMVHRSLYWCTPHEAS